ncbi:1222_t:CDS:2 [Entrophospora sp. SA101]|nr:1222_t:CDS:2 [Entrophospora sp. SA101]
MRAEVKEVIEILGGSVGYTKRETPDNIRDNNQGIATIDWPANSPDLNPIENIWKLLNDNIQKHEDFPRTVNELKIALREECENLDRSVFEEVVTSIPKRIDAVLRANGGPTKY